MTDGRSEEGAATGGRPEELTVGRVRVQQLEVVDALGRPRVVIDGLGGPSTDDVVGVHLLDRLGGRRLDLMLLNGEPMISFAAGGNTMAEFGVRGSVHADDCPVTSYLLLCDARGRAVVRWEVSEVGELFTEVADQE